MHTVIAIVIIIVIFYIIYRLKNNMVRQKEKSKETPKEKPKETQKKILKKHQKKNQKKILKEKPQPKQDLVFMDIASNNKILGRIVILLFSDIVPKTCNNFRTLCSSKNNMSYKNCPFHRIIQDFMIQGGDFTRGDGTGGLSIYGDRFKDENFEIKHDQPYLLSMANAGEDTNGSQFFITTSETPHLDGKHVVFGKIIEGFNVVNYLNKVETNERDRPSDDIRISNCGIL